MKKDLSLTRKFKDFVINTENGQRIVKAPRKMTLAEAMIYFNALTISGVK